MTLLHRRTGPRRWRAPGPLVVAALLVTAILATPIAAIAVAASTTGFHEITTVLFRPISATLLRNTILLIATVTPCCIVLGVGAAWLTERTDLLGRRFFSVLIVLPLVMPDFAVGYAWHTLAPTMPPLAAATIVMTLASYPLVYLPVVAGMRRLDPRLDEAAQSLGVRGPSTFLRVTMPLLWPAIAGGALVVIMTLISEYGAFEIVRFNTFTTEIFTEFKFEPSSATVLSIPLILIAIIVLAAELAVPQPPNATRASGRRGTRVRLGPSMILAWAMLLGLAALAIGVPVGTLVYWMVADQATTLPADATLRQATSTTVEYSAAGAALAVLLALPIAMLAARSASRLARLLQRAGYLVLALPGVIVALSLVYLSVHLFFRLYETATLLIVAYALLAFPLALSCLMISAQQAPTALRDIGRSLGRSGPWVFIRVTLPLLLPGLLAGFCLVFLTTTTELTATLILAPIDTQTLATQFWAFQSENAYSAAAPYALVIIAISTIPAGLLALWFDSGSASTRTARATDPDPTPAVEPSAIAVQQVAA